MDYLALCTLCLLVLVPWKININVCYGFDLIVKPSCNETGETTLDNRPLTLRSIFDNNGNVEYVNEVLANGDAVRVEGYAGFLPSFRYYGCFYHKLTEESVDEYPRFMERLYIETLDHSRPMYDCFQKCYTRSDELFYMGIGFDRCLCTNDISIFYTFTMPDQTCEESFNDLFKPVYRASSFYNIVVFKVDAISPNLESTGLNKGEPFLKLYSFLVDYESGSIDKLYGLSFDNVYDVMCASRNRQPVDRNTTISFLSTSRKISSLSDAHSICLENGMFLASMDTNQTYDITYNNQVNLLGEFSYLSIFGTKPSYDNSCVVLEKILDKLFIKPDNCSVSRPLVCVTDTNTKGPPPPTDEGVTPANYIIPIVSLFIVSAASISIFLICKCRRSSNCKLCYKGHQRSNHRTSVSVPGRMAGNTRTGSVNVPGRIAGHINAGNVRGITITGSSDGAVPGCNNIGQYCIESSEIEFEDIEEVSPDL